MEQVVIENPVINSPFVEPARHFRFADEGIALTPDPSPVVTGEGSLHVP
jgi:hypothetical protein